MPPSLAEVGRRGRLDLTFSCRAGRTVLRDAYCEVPFKITRLLDSGPAGMAHLILMQSTAGLFGGDTVELSIRVESGARVLVTQQSATKAHPSAGRLAVQTHTISVAEGGELRLHLEPLIPFAGSRVEQRVAIDLAEGARFSYWEALMAGRVARGERWAFETFDAETRVRAGGRLRFLDRYALIPGECALDDPWTMGAAPYLGTGLCYDERATELADCLHESLPGAGVAVLEAGLVAVRIAAQDGVAFHRARATFCGLGTASEFASQGCP